MCFFDSPVSRCEMAHEMVLTDQTQAECAREHACPAGCDCPLRACFAETSGLSETVVPAARIATREMFGPWSISAPAPLPAAAPWRGKKATLEQRAAS